jgi:hypothetical protein
VAVLSSRHLLLVMTCLFLSIGPGASGEDADAPASALPGALTGVRAAFLSNDPTRMARLFSHRAPVFVSVPPIADGCLAPGPLRAFLDRLVRDRVSIGFDLPSHVPPGLAEEPASAFIRVKWTHRPAASATLQVEYLHLALRYAAEDSEWQIVEMRTSMR